ncbi:multiple sugar transport system permease protein/raffinose/stachyose/melibiose transport system permease protein [Microbacterium halimionae]|uniref:Multiple sugar transport system permease protein/raffinose/stachyose/melibiose transport system permease protein n=1 Tax=Microbacterium halimionae TaxID=1526413 RepID=A0A7W3JQJ5_9MICO|nr:sugar ABC transporter permease [Microbacterium halimionae]MBA8817177.1 multiple sugar transport system permease protein/raffinose/stachyose/melibiose transport system permease protein [Microbacterium halimionae]NII94627.1 multiple sugar transport system permease protein/raffinose/stachyose/melibiose transport system permease protein [Microbacterium halimionae]
MNKLLGDPKAVLVLLGPAFAVYSLVMLVPIFWSLGYTVLEGNSVTGFEFVGFDNFVRFFQDPTAIQAVGFTIRYALVLTLLQVAAGYGLALLYVFYLKRGSAIVRTLVFFPVILPTVAVALLFRRFFEAAPTTGPVNAIIEFLGGASIDWFGQPDASFWVIILMDLWRSMGFYAVLLYAGVVEIPDDIIESARLDGASGLRLVRSIIVPLSLPVLMAAIIFSINGTLKVFDTVVALTNGGPGTATTPLTVYMFRTSFSFGQYGYGSTVALMLSLLCLAVTLFIFRASQRDLTKGKS